MTYKLTEYPAGIWMPLLKNRFIVRFDCDREQALQRQLVSCKIDYVNKELTVEIEQDSISTIIHDILFNLISGSSALTDQPVKRFDRSVVNIFVEPVRQDGEDTMRDSSLQFRTRIKAHTFELAYADSGTTNHTIVFSIENMIPYEKKI